MKAWKVYSCRGGFRTADEQIGIRHHASDARQAGGVCQETYFPREVSFLRVLSCIPLSCFAPRHAFFPAYCLPSPQAALLPCELPCFSVSCLGSLHLQDQGPQGGVPVGFFRDVNDPFGFTLAGLHGRSHLCRFATPLLHEKFSYYIYRVRHALLISEVQPSYPP